MKTNIIWILMIAVSFNILYNAYCSSVKEDDEELKWRLPKYAEPSSYNLSIETHILNEKEPYFIGKVNITFKTSKPTSKLILHKKDLQSKREEITITQKPIKSNDKAYSISDDTFHAETDKWTLIFNDTLPPDQYTISIPYKGKLSNDMRGFYKSDSTDHLGNPITIGATQFQKFHARRAFPCFDEPHFKANFTININHERKFKTVLSNGKMIESTPEGDRYLTTFEETPKMSTYIVAFLVSDFEIKNVEDFYVAAQHQYIDKMNFSLEEGQKLLKKWDNYTKLPYAQLGIKKMHLVAIPDFSAGAMENWGLLTFRERLLVHDSETTEMAEQKISQVIAHEQAHMWFGDLVTCDWWTHTWLNEGFARYFQYYITHELHPDWELDKQITVDQMHTVFIMDSQIGTHPMSTKNKHSTSAINKLSNQIVYNKAASVIRMFKYVLGEENFRNSLRSYLKEREYEESTPKHLFDEFNKVWQNDKINATNFFINWTEQVGYPVVEIKLSDDGKKIKLTQKRFLLDDDATEKDLKYIIPFTYTTSKKQNFVPPEPKEIIFFDSNHEITLESNDQLKDDDWIIGNIDQMGYFRVFYEDKILNNIKNALESKDFGKISEINRAHLIDDLFNFARAGTNDLKYEKVFEILSYLENEKHYIPWTAAFNGLSYIESKLGHDVSELKKRIKQSFKAVYDHLKFDNPIKNRLDLYNREKVLHWACKYDYSNCQEEADKIFEEYKNKKDKLIEKSIRSVVYCSTLRNAKNDENYKVLQQHFIDVKIPTEKVLTLNSLGCVKEKKHVEEHYKFIISDKVRKQDRVAALNALVSENPDSPQYVIDLFKGKEEFEKLKNALGSETEVASIVSNIANRFTTEEQKKDIEKLVEHFQNADTKETISKAASKVDKNKKWLEKYNESLRAGLRGGVGVKSISGLLITITAILYFYMIY